MTTDTADPMTADNSSERPVRTVRAQKGRDEAAAVKDVRTRGTAYRPDPEVVVEDDSDIAQGPARGRRRLARK